MSFKQAFVPVLIWCADLDFFRKPPASEYRRVDAVRVVRSSNQEHIVMGIQVADEAASLLDQLDIMLRLQAVIPREQAVHFVDKNDGRAVLLSPREEFRQLLHRSAGRAPENISGRDRIEAALGLRCDKPANHGLSSAWRSNKQKSRRSWQFQSLAI